MSKKLELAQDKLMEHIRNLCSKFGLNSFVAQIFVVLYFSKKPISLDDLTKRLHASKGNVSINIRVLESWGAVRKIWIRGSRKDYYEAEPDIKRFFLNKIKASLQKSLSESQRILDEFKQVFQESSLEITGEEKETLDVYKERLSKIEELKTLASNLLSLAENIL